MCGIVGIARWSEQPGLTQRVERMALAVRHRGPDDGGTWSEAGAGVTLGHRRLSIIDTSPTGHQPMVSAGGRYVLVFNGMIYNFESLRSQLEAEGLSPHWKGHSDTEVLLAAIEAWGLETALQRSVGMFALALWDRSERALSLARDRMGEKPLYYGVVCGEFIFASELAALREGAARTLEIDRGALALYMQFSYVPGAQSIYSGVHKLMAGHWLTLRGTGTLPVPKAYWSLASQPHSNLREQLAACTDNELITQTHDLMMRSVGTQMVADVPLGAFLSGGVDSSAVVAMMQAQSRSPVRTFTIGFEEGAFDESPHARAVAQHLGTTHTELRVTAAMALDLIPELPRIYSEPFADSSQIPTALVARLTRQHVTVSLSGDGGDELFAGYPRYALTAALWKRVGGLPPALRRTAGTALGAMSAQSWDRLLYALPGTGGHDINGRRIHHLARLLRSNSLGEMYTGLLSHWPPRDNIVLGAAAPAGASWPQGTSDIDAMRRWDIGQSLVDDMLVKVDRATMNAGLEARAPFLDHRLVEFALALPERVLVRGDVGKWILREALYRHVPRQLIERPKAGFEIPLGHWLRGPLRGWAETLLDRRSIESQGHFDGAKLAAAWQDHCAGRFDRSIPIWNVLMFQAWLQTTSAASPQGTPRPMASLA